MQAFTKKCSKCNYAILIDEGYSNYTVENTTLYCSLNLNPEAPFDKWYGEDKKDLFANSCEKYTDTVEPVYIDVEMDLGGANKYTNGFVTIKQIKDVL